MSRSVSGLQMCCLGAGAWVMPTETDGMYRCTTGTMPTGEGGFCSESEAIRATRRVRFPSRSVPEEPFAFRFGIAGFGFFYDDTSPVWRFHGVDLVNHETFVRVDEDRWYNLDVCGPVGDYGASWVEFRIDGELVGRLFGWPTKGLGQETLLIASKGNTRAKSVEVVV